ncbi:MAG: J domain-containing protein [Chitinophagales bacterium]|nr:J domain-containing protein [Chitinophagales bacterium]
MKDYYKILDIHYTASPEEIKKSYKRLAKRYHPDLNSGNKDFEERFKEINEAYEVLSNSNERHHYDDLFRYIILKENQNYTEQHTHTYSAPTREHEPDPARWWRFAFFSFLALSGFYKNCNNGGNSFSSGGFVGNSTMIIDNTRDGSGFDFNNTINYKDSTNVVIAETTGVGENQRILITIHKKMDTVAGIDSNTNLYMLPIKEQSLHQTDYGH